MDALNAFTEMYVCTNYIKSEKKLRIQIGRPNYNSRDLEAASIILSVSLLIDEESDEGPPRHSSKLNPGYGDQKLEFYQKFDFYKTFKLYQKFEFYQKFELFQTF